MSWVTRISGKRYSSKSHGRAGRCAACIACGMLRIEIYRVLVNSGEDGETPDGPAMMTVGGINPPTRFDWVGRWKHFQGERHLVETIFDLNLYNISRMDIKTTLQPIFGIVGAIEMQNTAG